MILDPQRIFCDPDSPAFLRDWTTTESVLQTAIESFRFKNLPLLVTRHLMREEPTESVFDLFFSHRLTESDQWSSLLPEFEESDFTILRKEQFSLFTDRENEKSLTSFDWLLLGGVRSELCVLTNAIALHERGITPIILLDGCCSKSLEQHLAAMTVAASGIAFVTDSQELKELELI